MRLCEFATERGPHNPRLAMPSDTVTGIEFSAANPDYIISFVSYLTTQTGAIERPRTVHQFERWRDIEENSDNPEWVWDYGVNTSFVLDVGNRKRMRTAIILRSQQDDDFMVGCSISGNSLRYQHTQTVGLTGRLKLVNGKELKFFFDQDDHKDTDFKEEQMEPSELKYLKVAVN